MLLGAITALGSLAIHMFVPAMPIAAAMLRASPSVVQLTLTLYLVGVGTGQIVSGPLMIWPVPTPIRYRVSVSCMSDGEPPSASAAIGMAGTNMWIASEPSAVIAPSKRTRRCGDGAGGGGKPVRAGRGCRCAAATALPVRRPYRRPRALPCQRRAP